MQKFSLESREAQPFVQGISSAVVSADGNNLLVSKGDAWQVLDAGKESGYIGENANSAITLDVNLTMRRQRS